MRFRTIFISDMHLGSRRCRAAALLDFLRRTTAEHIYLVGDIIEGWRWRRMNTWPRSHVSVLNALSDKAASGTRITYILGNHDPQSYGCVWLKSIELLRFVMSVDAASEAIHVTSDNKRLLVTHGHKYDRRNRLVRALHGVIDWPINQKAMAQDAQSKGLDGVICGHSHRPALRSLDGLVLGDCGDWLSNMTTIVESHSGRLELLHWV